MNKLLSIHIPTYNRPQLLKRLLKVAVPQAEKYSIPIYISDDSTNNNSKNYIEKLQYKYIFYTKTNKRLSRNFINTMKQSKTKFCWAIGDDDVILPKSIDTLLNVIESKPELQLILINAIYSNKQHTKYYLSIKNDLYFTNCLEFFSEFYNKTHFSVPIINTSLFKNSNTDKYLKTFHLFTGGIWEYLADSYNQNKRNDILVISHPMVFLEGGKKTWQPHAMYVKYYDRFLWLNLLPKIYKAYAEKIYKELLQKKIKEILKDRAAGQLKISEIDELFYYFPARTKIIAKTPIFIAKFIIKIEFPLKNILKKIKLFNITKKIYLKLKKI